MNTKYIEKLEFNKIIEILANSCLTYIGKDLANNLTPQNNKALVVLILAADIYASTTNHFQVNDESRTALAYISEKIRQNDTDGALSIVTIEQTDCIALSQDFNGTLCTTYIYEYEGMLKELFIQDGVSISLQNGTDIMELSALSIEELDNQLYQFTATDQTGTKSSIITSERSVP